MAWIVSCLWDVGGFVRFSADCVISFNYCEIANNWEKVIISSFRFIQVEDDLLVSMRTGVMLSMWLEQTSFIKLFWLIINTSSIVCTVLLNFVHKSFELEVWFQWHLLRVPVVKGGGQVSMRLTSGSYCLSVMFGFNPPLVYIFSALV